MRVTQHQFSAAILDPGLAVPEGLADPAGRPAGKRFDVYRNNVVVSLMKALQAAFPAVAGSLGQDNFRIVAAAHVRQSPPTSPLMMHFGAAFPAFLEGFAPLARHPWLGDLARLELALRESYHGGDAAPVTGEELSAVAPERLADSRARLAPAVRLIRSRWPVLSLWRAQIEGAPPPTEGRGEAVVILRPDFDPVPHLLPAGGATFLLSLMNHQTFGTAAAAARAAVPTFDLTATLGLLIGGGALTRLEPEP